MEKYDVVKEIGAGGEGTCLLGAEPQLFAAAVNQKETEEKFVLKKKLCTDLQEANDALKEAMYLAQFSSDYIVRYKDVFLESQEMSGMSIYYLCIIMEYCPRGSLFDLVLVKYDANTRIHKEEERRRNKLLAEIRGCEVKLRSSSIPPARELANSGPSDVAPERNGGKVKVVKREKYKKSRSESDLRKKLLPNSTAKSSATTPKVKIEKSNSVAMLKAPKKMRRSRSKVTVTSKSNGGSNGQSKPKYRKKHSANGLNTSASTGQDTATAPSSTSKEGETEGMNQQLRRLGYPKAIRREAIKNSTSIDEAISWIANHKRGLVTTPSSAIQRYRTRAIFIGVSYLNHATYWTSISPDARVEELKNLLRYESRFNFKMELRKDGELLGDKEKIGHYLKNNDHVEVIRRKARRRIFTNRFAWNLPRF